MNTRFSPSFDLFALPSLSEGVGSIVDVAGSFHNYNESMTPQEADAKALRSDWEAIGIDFSAALDEFHQEVSAS